MSKLLIKMFMGSLDYFSFNDEEISQVVGILIPDKEFQDLLLHKTYFSRKYGIIGQAVLRADVVKSDTY